MVRASERLADKIGDLKSLARSAAETKTKKPPSNKLEKDLRAVRKSKDGILRRQGTWVRSRREAEGGHGRERKGEAGPRTKTKLNEDVRKSILPGYAPPIPREA